MDISADTQVVLLLMGRFSRQSEESASPLTPREYNQLAIALNTAGLRPADLLRQEASGFISERSSHGIDHARLDALLRRSIALALTLESWSNAGFWVMSRSDETYPQRFRARLKGKAPSLLFGCGEPDLLNQGGLAVIGSRNVDEDGQAFTESLARQAAADGIQVISGGARGVDSIAMVSALERGGTVVGVLANDLSRTARAGAVLEAVQDDRLCLVSPSQPEARFEAWRAMDRNKSIYALSDWAVVVSSELRKGGTWAGAKENLDAAWVPLLVRADEGTPEGNAALLAMGATPIGGAQIPELGGMLRSISQVAEDSCPDADGDEPPQMSLF